ncbi:MAG: response regulator [Candidatus Omnitrophica bacterium]|nr:response regulator [Candidatus Omnitrophota bacterium]
MIENESKVLVVEDDKDISELISYNLKKEEFVVTQVFDGFNALKMLNQEFFNIVILDLMLPGIDGFDICKKIKENKSAFKTFIIVVSAKNSNQDKLYAHILGANCYLTKPFNMGDLKQITKEAESMQNREFIVEKIAKGGRKMHN